MEKIYTKFIEIHLKQRNGVITFLQNIKTSILSTLISQLNVSPIKILIGPFLESDTLNKQFI